MVAPRRRKHSNPNAQSRRSGASPRFSTGEHLKVKRRGYSHHGLATGEGTVIHYAGKASGFSSGAAPVCEVSLEAFAGGSTIHIVPHKRRHFSRAMSVQRARSRVDEDHYSVVGNNCEHFVQWAIDGLHESHQVDRGAQVSGALNAVVAAGGGLGMVKAAGGVAGLSGSGIMSGLAAIGPGGVVGGVATLAGGAGVGMNVFLENTVLKDAPGLDESERRARNAGRWAARGATGASTAGGVAAIALKGTVAGLSGSGVSSGLAAIGSVVGGGMTAGIGLVVAAPVVAAAASGIAVTAIARRTRR